ncbi:CST complex subunit TEN1-like [Gigantopelta aegis]|uniref:CST complex subunit TEN1-like n=1 Tax=Gigantopelta aegis TaxID=1735272 RepID=UPI001B8891AD|nr:CST complex subunit TEN1-like [Gigantopelta aegis]
MAKTLPQSGEPLLISEIFDRLATDAASLEGKSIRVTGRLQTHNVHDSTVMVTDPKSTKSLIVDTSLIEPFCAKLGSLFQFIGEVDCLSEDCDMKLTARVVRCVDGLDLVMYEKALAVQRQYLEQRS